MSPGKASGRIVLDRCAAISAMLEAIRRLPLDTRADFMADARSIWTVDSCLRRSLEAQFDIGRHILARSYGRSSSSSRR